MNYAYIRFSTDKQDERQQMNAIEDFLKGKDMSVDDYVMDEGVSGGVSYKNRKLFGLVSGMKPGDALIVTEISRLGRSMSDLNKLVNDELKTRGVRLIVITMGIDIDCSRIKAMDEMLLFAFSFAAQIEKEMIQERTRSALEARRKSGQEIGGTNALWGSKNGADRKEAMRKITDAASAARTERALKNKSNREFFEFISDWIEAHGPIAWQTDWKSISDKLNSRGKTTATGLPFTPKRAKAMYDKIKTMYGENI